MHALLAVLSVTGRDNVLEILDADAVDNRGSHRNDRCVARRVVQERQLAEAGTAAEEADRAAVDTAVEGTVRHLRTVHITPHVAPECVDWKVAAKHDVR